MRALRGASAAQSLALGAVLVLAVALRFAGLTRGLPHRIEPDAFVAYQLQAFEGDPALVHGVRFADRYPSFLARAFSLLPYPEVPARPGSLDDEGAHRAAAARPFILVRATVAIFSCVGVLLTWFLARRFLPPWGALAATFLCATSLLSLLFSGQARPHGVQATFALAAVVAALRARERPDAARILLATLAAAAAAATLQNGLFALIPLGACVLLGGGQSSSRAGRIVRAGVACLAATAAALAFYPGLPYVDEQGIHLGPGAGGAHWIRPSLSNLGGIRAFARLLWEHEPVLAVLAPAGAILGGVRLARAWGRTPAERKSELAVVLAYVLPYLVVLALDPNVHDRFLLPLLPFLACLAAGTLVWFASAARGPGLVVSAVVLVAPLYPALRFSRAAASPDTLERAAEWVRAHVAPTEVVLTTPGTVLPLIVESETLELDLEDPTEYSIPWLAYQSLIPPAGSGAPRFKLRLLPVARRFDPKGFDLDRAREWIRDSKAGFVLVEDSLRMRQQYHGEELEAAAAEAGELVFAWEGRIPAPTDTGPIEYQGARRLAWRVLSAEAFGPGVRIYRIQE